MDSRNAGFTEVEGNGNEGEASTYLQHRVKNYRSSPEWFARLQSIVAPVRQLRTRAG